MKRITLIILAVTAIIAGSVSCGKVNDINQNPLSMVTLNIVPDYSDGSVYSCSDDGSLFLRVSVKPEKYIEKMLDNEGLICKADLRSVITKASSENPDITVIGEITSASVEEGYITAYFDLAEDEVAKLQQSDYVVSFSIEDKDGVHGASTSYVLMNNPQRGLGGDIPVDKAIFDLSMNGTANCYIVPQAGFYKFKAVKGNTNESVGDVKGVKVLWETFGTATKPNVGDLIKADVAYADGYISFSTNDTYHKGNAVIAAYSDAGCTDGNVLWSWHIWLTDQPIEQKYMSIRVYYGTLMDRNLGATSATPGDVEFLGLLYQWGRKDPFLGSSAINTSGHYAPTAESTISWPPSVATSETVGTVDYVTKNPTTFLTSSSQYPFDWSIPQNDNLWSSSKTQYDPCPPGWRVPSSNVWDFMRLDGGYTSANYYTDSKTYQLPVDKINCYYPEIGRRQGDILFSLHDGLYWTCDVFYIYFQANYQYPGGEVPENFSIKPRTNNINGYAVRCQKIE